MAVKCYLSQIGSSEWRFEDEIIGDDTNLPCCTIETDLRGQKLISNKKYRRGDQIVIEQSLMCCPYGEHRNRICWNCLRYGHTKVKVSSEFDNIFFCSHECLDKAEDFLHSCGALISYLYSSSQPVNLILCVKFLYSVLVEHDMYLQNLVLQHEQHETLSLPEIDNMSAEMAGLIRKYSPILFKLIDDPPLFLRPILRSLQFNSQPFDIPDLPKTSFLCFYNHLSRINHSCQPNSTFSFHISPSNSSIFCSVISLSDISPGDEVTISYLSQLCLPYQSRREFLREGFQFNCQCSRCMIEEKCFSIVSNDRETSHEIWNPIDIKASLSSSPFLTRSLTDRLTFLSQIEDQIIALDRRFSSLSSNLQNQCIVDPSPSALRKEYSSVYKSVYEHHDLLVLLIDSLLHSSKQSSKKSVNLKSTDEELLMKDVILIQLCNRLQDCWSLIKIFFLPSSSKLNIFEDTLFGANLLIISGGSASRLVKLLHNSANSMDRDRVSHHILMARGMIERAQGFINLLAIDHDIPHWESSREFLCGYRGLVSRIEKLMSMLS